MNLSFELKWILLFFLSLFKEFILLNVNLLIIMWNVLKSIIIVLDCLIVIIFMISWVNIINGINVFEF